MRTSDCFFSFTVIGIISASIRKSFVRWIVQILQFAGFSTVYLPFVCRVCPKLEVFALDSPLRIAVLGKPQLAWHEEPLTADLISAKGQALLVYLAVTRQTSSRQSISGLLWGDLPEERARGNLRFTLSKLRSVVGDYLVATRQSLAFDASLPHYLDAAEFIRHCASPEKADPAELESAVDLYRGNFLDDFHLHDAPDFETWVVVERERFQQMALASLAQLAACAQAQNEFEKAVAYTRRILSFEPWREEAHRQLMTLLAQSGQRTAALSQFEICRKLLDEELGVEPSAETMTLYEGIKSGDVKEADGESARRVESKSRSSSSPRKSASDSRHNLPQQPMPFLGREDELAKIAELLASADCRLLTLMGPGGVGKTRLSINAAHMVVDRFRDGVRFLSLRGMKPSDPIETTELLIASLADTVGYTFSAQRSPRELLLGHLADKEYLFVLDNFEPLLSPRLDIRAHTEKLLLDILNQCPQVKLLVTSRERLNINSEWLLEVHGLPYPPTFEREATKNYPSVELFVQQARRNDPNFSTSKQEYSINRICQLVAGFPLGVELAANWVRLLSCAEIAERLERGADILTADQPDSGTSLRPVLDSTWEMLNEQEREVFRKLSVFREGFTLPAAQQVADASLTVLNSLMNKSMLRRDENGRYVLHELLVQFGSYHLNFSPEQERTTRQKHGRFYGSFLSARRTALADPFDQSALTAIDAEIENIRAALEWHFEQKDVEEVDQYVESLFPYLQRKGWLQEAVFVVEEACGLEQASDMQKGFWRHCLGDAYYSLGNFSESARNVEEALRLLGYPIPNSSLGLSIGIGVQALKQVWRRMVKYRPSALDLEERKRRGHAALIHDRLTQIYFFRSQPNRIFFSVLFSLNLAETLGSSPERTIIYISMAIGMRLAALPAAAEYYFNEAMKMARQPGNRSALMWALASAGLYHLGYGEWKQAKDVLEQSTAIFKQIGNHRYWEESSGLQGEMAYLQGRFADAHAIQKETLASARYRGDSQFQFHELTGFALNALRMGDLPQAKESLNEASSFLEENRDIVEEIRFYGVFAQFHLQRGDMDSAKQSAALAMERIVRNRPTAFYSLEGYAGVSEVYLAALENEKNAEDLKAVRRAVKSLHEFGRILPIGRPRAWLHQGLLDWAEGRQKKAFAAWEKSLGLAEQMSLPYEAARAYFEIGRHVEVNSTARQIHLQKTIEMFSELGAKYELQEARELEQTQPARAIPIQ
jgi:DNA-binding SARP family transcriptional activator/predicted ATPase